MELTSVATPLFWAGFVLFILAMLTLDLFFQGGRNAHRVSAREAARRTLQRQRTRVDHRPLNDTFQRGGDDWR